MIKHIIKQDLKEFHPAPLEQDADMSTANRLREAMDNKGIGPSELARHCGVTPAAVTGWLKRGANGMRLGNLLCVSDTLGVTVEWLARGGSQRQAAMRLTDDEIRFMEDLRTLLPQDREAVMRDTSARAEQLREHAQHILGLAHSVSHIKTIRKR